MAQIGMGLVVLLIVFSGAPMLALIAAAFFGIVALVVWWK